MRTSKFKSDMKFNELLNNAEQIEESLNQEMNFMKSIAAQHSKKWKK